jgi:hypothetical protein
VSLGHAQIGSLDTVCKGASVTYMDSSTADTYAWILDTINTVQTSITGGSIINLKAYGAPYAVVMVLDNSNSNYYAFVICRTGKLLRLDFGTNPYVNIPLPGGNITDLGNLGGALGDSSNGLDVFNDGTNWYGFITRNNKLIRVNFGSSITNNSPTTSVMPITNFNYPYQITMKKYGNEWIAFVANRNGNTITRLDFGTSITSTPSATDFGNGFQLQKPTQFSLYKESRNWYMIASNIGSGGGPGGNGGITRFEFGTDLKNNAPTGTLIGSLSGKLNQPRGINMFADCNQVFGLAFNSGNAKVTNIDFANTITRNQGSITGTDLGLLTLSNNITIQGTYPFWYGDRMSIMAASLGDSTLYIYDNVYTIPSNPYQTSYSQSTFTNTFNNGGFYNVTLQANQGSPRGPEAYCKQTYVINTLTVSIVQHHIDTLYASGTNCDWYIWKLNGVVITGATGRDYVPTQTGVYTCIGGKAGCNATSSYYFEYTGIASTANSKAVMVYPNPTTGVFTVELDGSLSGKTFNMACYNSIGTVVAAKELNGANGNSKTTIDLSNLPKGVYQLKLQADGEATVVKHIIVE